MPEAPDLQVYAKNLTAKVGSAHLEKLQLYSQKRIKFSEDEAQEKICGYSIEKIEREGKELWFYFSSGNVLSLHLMLKGSMSLVEDDKSITHKVATFHIRDHANLVISDQLRWVTMKLNPSVPKSPDILSDDFNTEYLVKKAARTSKTIKELLLDQNAVRGIGNAYADEILWEAKIHPLSICKKIPESAIEKIPEISRHVIERAVEAISKQGSDIISGETRDFLKVHNKEKKETPTGFPIPTEKNGNRTTYYTEEQQNYI